jgi:drug/metabolite transporter, DME family
LVLHERLTRVTVVCGLVALGGLSMTVLGDLGTGNMKGNIAAMLSCVGFAIYMVCIRSSASRDWSPALPGYAIGLAVLCAVITVGSGRSLVPSLHDIVLALIHGGVIIVSGTLVFNRAAKSVPAVGMALFALIENALVPIWIFLWFAERPTTMALLGGLVIMTAVIGKALLDGRARAAESAIAFSHEGV